MLIRTKIVIGVVFMSVFMIVIGVIGLAGFNSSNKALEQMYSVNLRHGNQLNTINGLLRANRIQLLLALQHDPHNEFSYLHDHPVSAHTDLSKKYSTEAESLIKEYGATLTSPEGRQLLNIFKKSHQKYEQEGLDAAAAAVNAGNFHETYRITFDVINPAIQQANKDLDALMKFETRQAEISSTAAGARYAKYRNIVIVFLIIAVLVGSMVGFVVSRSITRTSDAMQDFARKLAGGDFTVRSNLSGKDELALISAEFDAMADSMSKIVEKIALTTTEVAGAAAQVHASSKIMVKGVEDVNNQATTVATAGEEMAATSGDIAGNCLMAAEGAGKVTDAANSGVQIIQESIRVMNRISERVSATASTVDSLGDRSDQIGQIVGTIEDIADQTNLLALNAAIEAARAGEQGRGFAVVADEVRALAERTTRATREIGDMIKAIQSETRGAVSAMEEGVSEVERGTQEAGKSGEAMGLILNQISNLSMQVNQIATAAEEQTATTSEISRSILEITDVAGTASENAQHAVSQANHLNSLAESLTTILNGLTIADSVELSITRAKTAHIIFCGKIKTHLDGGQKIDPDGLPNHLTCAFGKWYQTKGHENCGHTTVFRDIDAPHAKVHEHGKQAALAYNSGDHEAALRHCDEMTRHSQLLLGMLEQLQSQCA